MKRASTVMVCAVVIASALGLVQAQQGQPEKKSLIFSSAGSATFKEVVPGVSKASLWGDADKGPYGSFTKFVPGHDSGMHTHTNDVWIVVLKGAYVFRDEAGEKRVAAGDFLRIPGGHKHWSGGDAKEGALFYEESSGKFDLVPAK
jgi:mannose-6-phosphate isomerase-like protein (cupin superfamily)